MNVFLIFHEVALIVAILIILICKLNMHIYYFFFTKPFFTPLLEAWYNPKCVEWIFKHLIKDAKRSFLEHTDLLKSTENEPVNSAALWFRRLSS